MIFREDFRAFYSNAEDFFFDIFYLIDSGHNRLAFIVEKPSMCSELLTEISAAAILAKRKLLKNISVCWATENYCYIINIDGKIAQAWVFNGFEPDKLRGLECHFTAFYKFYEAHQGFDDCLCNAGFAMRQPSRPNRFLYYLEG